ncbi:unnamed protein product [Alopecurus aequalis]
MARSSSFSKLYLLLQLLLLSQLLEARILGDGYDCKSLSASDVDDDDAASSSHLNLDNGALYRPSKYAPPSPKPRPSPHPVLGCRPHHQREGDGVQEPLQMFPPASSSTGPAPPRDYYGSQEAEAAGHPPSRPGKMMDAFRAFLDACGWQI